MTAENKLCSNCASPLKGRWRSQCGQKALSDSDRRIGHLIGQFAHELLHLEGKLPRTLGALIFRPGLPSAAYLAGRRVAYLSPIGLFLLVNLLYFIAPPMTDFNLSLDEQYHVQPYSVLIQPMVDARLARRDIEFDTYAEHYGQLNLNLARSLIILHLPLLALALKLLFIRRQTYYAEHFVVATHLFTFLLLLALLMYPLASLMLWVGQAGFGSDLSGLFRVIWSTMPLVILVHWFLSLKRCYQPGWVLALLATLAFCLATIVSHFIFRLVQFLAVFAAS
ncbi:MAG: DUF3667 domain-containing protein [Wenzhouxiangella sp.]|nr:DUF3667 domain-containing protein [Wenzhouxiangella sp.]MCH8479258.1 DUF3667 domain-containing protein [Wenzhouxiangella sp.]